MNGGGGSGDSPGGAPSGGPVKYQRWFRIIGTDDGGYFITQSHDAEEVAITGDGTEVRQRQKLTTGIAPTRVDLHAAIDEWCNEHSDIAVEGLNKN